MKSENDGGIPVKDIELSVQDIKDFMAAMHKYKISGFKLDQGNFHLELEGCRTEQVAVTAVATASAAVTPQEEECPQYEGTPVCSPIVGTFYAAPAPGQEPFVKVGSKVKKGDTLFIIESMKLMNEVPAEQDGVVTQILVENAQGVEYGQPILCLE